MRHPSPVRLAIPPVLFFLLGVAAPLYAQEDLIQRLRSGIEGVARGMDSVGRKAGSLIGATPLSDDQPAPYTEKREFEQRYPTGAAPMVTVSNEFGEIRVDTWNERVVQVRAEMVTGADSAEKAAQLSKAITINVAPAEDLFEIRTLLPETRGDMGHISISVRYHITIPKDASLVADNYFGDVVARGVGGLLGLDVQYGAVDIADTTGQVRVRCHGEFPVTARNLAQGGSFELKGSQAELTDVRGPLKISSFGGGLTLSRLGPELEADITVDSGRAALTLDPGTDPDLTATVVYGAFESDLDVTRSGQGDRFVARHPNAGGKQRVTMNASFSDITIKVAGTVAASPAPGGGSQVFNDTKTERLTLPPDATVAVEAAAGHVRVEGWDAAELKVTATRVVWVGTASSAPQALEALQFTVQQAPGTVTVHTLADGDMARFGCTSHRVDLLVQMPKTAVLRVNAADGVTSVTGLQGGATVNQARGEAAVDNTDGALAVSNQQGAVRISDCSGPAEVSARQGTVTLARIRGLINAQNVDGRTVIESPRGGVQARNNGGDVRLLSLEPLGGDVDIRVDRGAISALLAPESSATLTLRATDGRVQSGIPLTGSINGALQEFTGRLNDGQFNVLLEAAGGNIVLN